MAALMCTESYLRTFMRLMDNVNWKGKTQKRYLDYWKQIGDKLIAKYCPMYSQVHNMATVTVLIQESSRILSKQNKDHRSNLEVVQIRDAEQYLFTIDECYFMSVAAFLLFQNLALETPSVFTFTAMSGCLLLQMILHGNCNRSEFWADIDDADVNAIITGESDVVLTSSKGK